MHSLTSFSVKSIFEFHGSCFVERFQTVVPEKAPAKDRNPEL